MSCSNCYNNCPEITSDRCVRYTGIDVPVLGIKSGDSLSYVEQALIEFLTSTLDGSGIKLELDPAVICTLVKNNLPTCGDLTLIDLSNALVKSICDLQTQITSLAGTVYTINSPYTTGCLTGITNTSSTHEVLQTTITKLCQLDSNVTSITTNLSQYVRLSDLCQLVTACLATASGGSGNRYYTRMVPYTVVEYYGTLQNFNAGVGQGEWENIYLCNGQTYNGVTTPDKRGRVTVGAILGVTSTVPLDNEVNPFAINPPGAFNPNYALLQKEGFNSVVLTEQQIPPHNHTFTGTASTHTHTLNLPLVVQPMRSATTGTIVNVWKNPTSGAQTYTTDSASVTPLGTTANKGGGNYHANNQPAIACYYIMYIP
jgi:microcystin-dependent protein